MSESKELFKQINGCRSCHTQQNNNNSNTSVEAVMTMTTTAMSTTTASTIGRNRTIKSHAKHLRQKQKQQQQQEQKQRLLLITMTLAALLPMPEARHVHQDADAAKRAYVDYSSASFASSASSGFSFSSSSESSSAAAASRTGSLLPAWQVNPLLGLGNSYEEAEESSISSSRASLDYSDNLLMNEPTYDEIVYKATVAAMRALRTQRLRWRRRRRNSVDLFDHSATDAPPTWENPCSGEFDPEIKDALKLPTGPPEPSAPFVNLRKTVLMNFHNAYDKQNVINTSHIKSWRYYRPNFKFLRKIRNDSNVCLKCWYRNFQTFIASFDRLGRMHYASDKNKVPYTASTTTHELYELLRDARQVLCQIENAINISYAQNHRAAILKVTSREEMNERLNFLTKISDDKLAEADLVYTKHRYIRHLKNMHTVLGTAIKTNNLIDHSSTKTSSKVSSASSLSSLISSLSSIEISSSEQQSNGISSASTSFEHKPRKVRRRKLTRPTK